MFGNLAEKLTELVRRVAAAARRFYRRSEAPAQVEPAQSKRGRPKIIRGEKEWSQSYGAYVSARELLADVAPSIDGVERAARFLRKHGYRDSAAILEYAGPVVNPRAGGDKWGAHTEIGGRLTEQRFGGLPSTGACYLRMPDNEKHCDVLYILNKMHKPIPGVAFRRGHPVYEMLCVYDVEHWWPRIGMILDVLYFSVVDGAIVPLPHMVTRKHSINGKVEFRTTGLAWGTEWAECVLDKKESPKKVLEDSASLILETTTYRDAALQVRCKRGRTRCTFLIPENRAPEFFRDRIDATASNGRKVPVFHYVAAHYRANGQTVRMHTRGSRRFQWGGVEVFIQTPGLRALPLSQLQTEAYLFDDRERPANAKVTVEDAMRRIAKVLEQ